MDRKRWMSQEERATSPPGRLEIAMESVVTSFADFESGSGSVVGLAGLGGGSRLQPPGGTNGDARRFQVAGGRFAANCILAFRRAGGLLNLSSIGTKGNIPDVASLEESARANRSFVPGPHSITGTVAKTVAVQANKKTPFVRTAYMFSILLVRSRGLEPPRDCSR
jgi:hypothetical protein